MLYNRKRRTYEAANRSFEHTYGRGMPRHVLHFYNIHPRTLSAPSSPSLVAIPDLCSPPSSRMASTVAPAPAFEQVGGGGDGTGSQQPALVKALSAPVRKRTGPKQLQPVTTSASIATPEVSSADPVSPLADQHSPVSAIGFSHDSGNRANVSRVPTESLAVTSSKSLRAPAPPVSHSNSNRTIQGAKEASAEKEEMRPALHRASTSPALLRGALRASTARPTSRASAATTAATISRTGGNGADADHISYNRRNNDNTSSSGGIGNGNVQLLTSAAPHLGDSAMGLKRVHIRTPSISNQGDAVSETAGGGAAASTTNWSRASGRPPRSAMQLRVDNFCARIDAWKRELRFASGTLE